MLERAVPVKRIKTAEGEALVTTVFDLFGAFLGIDRGIGGQVAKGLLLFSIPNLDFTSLHQDTSSQTDRILPEHENGRLYQFTRELGQNIGDGTGSFIKYISDFSGKLMNGGK